MSIWGQITEAYDRLCQRNEAAADAMRAERLWLKAEREQTQIEAARAERKALKARLDKLERMLAETDEDLAQGEQASLKKAREEHAQFKTNTARMVSKLDETKR